MTVARHLGLRLFLEGVEVPVVAADVTAVSEGNATAMLQIPDSATAHNLLPRTLVHLFYYEGEGVWVADKADNSFSRFVEERLHDVTDPSRWKLLFVGEVVGFGFSKQTGGRTITLICMDLTSYWDAARLYFGTKKVGNRAFKQAIFMGSVVGQRGKQKVDTSQTLVRLLQTKPSTMPTLQGLLGGLVHLLESATGVFVPGPEGKKHRGVSDFLSQAELRLKLTRILGINPNDTSSALLTGDKEFTQLVRQIVGASRSTASYGDLLRVLLSYIFHTYATQVCPAYIRKGVKAKYLKLVPVKARTSQKSAGLRGKLEKELDALSEALDARSREVRERVTTSGTPAGDAEYIAPGEDSLPDAFQNRINRTDNRVVADAQGQTQWVTTYDSRIATETKASELVQETRTSTEDEKNPTEFSSLRFAADHYANAVTITRTQLMGKSEYPDPQLQNIYPEHSAANWLAARNELDKAKAALKRRPAPTYKQVEKELTLNDRLILALFHPNIWMCPPPKCNVLFPGDYRAFSMQRMYLSEVTRYMLSGLRRNGTEDVAQTYFAPNIDIIANGTSKEDIAKAAGESVSFLLPHEKFTGIIPSINGVGRTASLGKLNKATEKEEPGEAFTSFGAKNPALARAAHSHFFDERFGSRNGSCSGPFLPRLVCGLPCLVLDPKLAEIPADQPWLKGVHYLGKIEHLNHSFSQEGAITSVGLRYVRTHNEGLSIFGTYEHKVSVVKTVKLGGGSKLPGIYWAEILGFRTRKLRVGTELVSVLTPVVGMNGVAGRQGPSVTLGLRRQNGNLHIGKKAETALNERAGDTFYADRTTDGATTGDYNTEVFSEADSLGLPVTYRIEPVFSKSRLTSASNSDDKLRAAFGSVTSEQWLDGYHVAPALSWMSARAIGAVQVSVFRSSGEPAKSKTLDFSFYFEQVARPPWFDASYLNQNIGEEYYTPLVGCNALTDAALLVELTQGSRTTPLSDIVGPLSVFGVAELGSSSLTEDEQIRLPTQISEETLAARLSKANEIESSMPAVIEVETPGGVQYRVPTEILGGVSTHKATEILADAYLRLSQTDAALPADVDRFVTDFTRRAHASMIDIFGYGWREGDPVPGTDQEPSGVIGTRYLQPFEEYDPSGAYTSEVSTAVEGFHSGAFGPLADLNLLPYEPLVDEYGDEPRTVNPNVDPRAERYARVLSYRDAVTTKVQRG